MKKILMFLTLILVTAIAVVAAQPDTIPTNIIIGDQESIGEVLKSWLWLIVGLVVSLVDTWLTRSGKVKPGSFLDFVIGLFYKIIKKQLPTQKAKFMSPEKLKSVLNEEQIKAVRGMKVIALLIMLSILPAAASAQGLFSQFGKVTRGAPASTLLKSDGTGYIKWFVKPTAQITGYALKWDAETNTYDGKEFAAFGIGVQVTHYATVSNALKPDWGVNGMFITNFIDPTSPGIGAALGITGLGFVNITVGRDFTNKEWLLMPGAIWTF